MTERPFEKKPSTADFERRRASKLHVTEDLKSPGVSGHGILIYSEEEGRCDGLRGPQTSGYTHRRGFLNHVFTSFAMITPPNRTGKDTTMKAIYQLARPRQKIGPTTSR